MSARLPVGTILWSLLFAIIVLVFLGLSHYWEALFLEALKTIGVAGFLYRYRSGLSRLGDPDKSTATLATVSSVLLQLNIFSDFVVAAVLHHNHQIGLSYWSK